MSRHDDDGPPGGAPGQPTPDPVPAGEPTTPPWTAPPAEPDRTEQSLPGWVVGPTVSPQPPPGQEAPNIVPGQGVAGRRLPDLTEPPAPTPTESGEDTSRLPGFRRRTLPAPDPHRQAPALEGPGAGGPGADPSESRTIVPGHTAPPGQLGAGIRGQLGPGSSPTGPVSHGQQVPSPVRPTPVPRAPAGQDLPPDLPSPPPRSPAAGEPARPGPTAAPPRRMTPEQIRAAAFGRSPLGRRGYNEDEVNQFANRLAEELAARDAEVVRLVDENHRLKQAMRDWQSSRIGEPDVDVAERVSAETAALMAKAQQQIDAQLAQTELYCRQREQEAVRRYDEIVRHARLQVKREAEEVAHHYRATSGAGYNPDQETLQRQQVYIGALLQALDALGAHVQATRQAFATEIGKLATDPLPHRVD